MKIAICGRNNLCLADAPWSNKEWKIWGLNIHSDDLQNIIPRFDMWFDLHKFGEIDLPYYMSSIDCKYGQFLEKNQENLVLSQHSDILNKSKVYPLQEIVRYFDCNYFNCSIAYMIAYAIYIGADEIALYGVDPPDIEKYRDQEENICFWMGIAKGRGIKVYNSMNSNMLKVEKLYAFEIPIINPKI